MLNCNVPGSRIWFSLSDNKNRKYPGTWEIVEVDNQHLAGINTARANHLVREAIGNGTVSELQGYRVIKAEVPYGEEKSRVDFMLQEPESGCAGNCYVEVKNLTLGMGKGLGVFPDAVTTRGQKHLRELMAMLGNGHRAVLLFCVQHTGITEVQPADDIDPVYGQLLREVQGAGVEVLAYGAELSPRRIALTHAIPVVL